MGRCDALGPDGGAVDHHPTISSDGALCTSLTVYSVNHRNRGRYGVEGSRVTDTASLALRTMLLATIPHHLVQL